MSEKPIVSIILPSIYPQLWMDTYSSLNIEKKVPFEIIAIGPVEPNFELPENFRYYKSSVKIPQCIEAGYRLAKGDYLLTISDDSAFKPNFLQKLYENINAVDMDRTFLVIQAARFWRGKIGSLYYKSRHKNIPKRERVLIGIYNCYKKDGIHAIGGIDRRFVAVTWHSDLSLRFYEKGYSSVLAKDILICEVDADVKTVKPRLMAETNFVDMDIAFGDSLWEDERGNLVKERKLPVDPFTGSIEEILAETQGTKGRW